MNIDLKCRRQTRALAFDMGHLAGLPSCYSSSMAKAARAHITRYTIPSDSCALLAPEHGRTPTMTPFRLFKQKLEGRCRREYSAWNFFCIANDFDFELLKLDFQTK
jgi:hypothetical protein